jgi:hypothetical protein
MDENTCPVPQEEDENVVLAFAATFCLMYTLIALAGTSLHILFWVLNRCTKRVRKHVTLSQKRTYAFKVYHGKTQVETEEDDCCQEEETLHEEVSAGEEEFDYVTPTTYPRSKVKEEDL